MSDWNHGNAHFLRGIALELISRSHQVSIYEPTCGWSLQNLLREHGAAAVDDFHQHFPLLASTFYDEQSLNLNEVLQDADVVIVHEWNSPELVARIGRHRATHNYQLFFHDTHHRSVSEPGGMGAYDLKGYDGVLAYGNVIRDAYLSHAWARHAFTWHEAADIRIFHPFPHTAKTGDLVWIGNWGDGERANSLREFLIEPVKRLGLKACVYGVRYPAEALNELDEAGIEYGGWIPNYRVPEVFAHYKVTIHVPRGPYVKALPGIPTIRPFEALACGIPLVSAPWSDVEHLFRPGQDFLFASSGGEMTDTLESILGKPQLSENLIAHGRDTILSRHTCAHRVDELLRFVESPVLVTAEQSSSRCK